jgi:selenocysteine lyase/cysteine desulfurase
MKLAARLLWNACRNVLVTDLGWPGYHDILEAECQRSHRTITTTSLRGAILSGEIGEDEAIEQVRRSYVQNRCDGLFLPAVSNLGVRLPVERIVRAVEEAAPVYFVVIDGAQAFCHAGMPLDGDYCDLYLSGCHKWLAAYHPMGLAFYGRRRSRAFIETMLGKALATGDIDDPLLHFSRLLETGNLSETTETVNLASLFSCQGAADDALTTVTGAASYLATRLQNLVVARGLAEESGWQPLLPCSSLQTGILLLEAERETTRELPVEQLRSSLYSRGVVVTAYDHGRIRLSMPNVPWRPAETEKLRAALRAAS